MQFALDLLKDLMEGFDVNLPSEFVQDFDKSAHVCALEMMGQIHVDVEHAIHMLRTVGAIQNDNWICDPLHTDFLYIYVSGVLLVLNVDHCVLPLYEARVFSDSHTVTHATLT
jgi:hypothetical protein